MKKFFSIMAAAAVCATAFAQTSKAEEQKEDEGYKFTVVKELPITSVKNQNQAGTCWCYSGLGFIEAELLRMGKGTYDFSEMYLVANTYNDRAMAAIRTSGDVSFSQGGAFGDVIYGMKTFGLVPEECMRPGVMYGDTLSNHTELSALTDAMVEAIAKNDKLKKLQRSPEGKLMCIKAIEAVHAIYLGTMPEKFNYNGKEYTPKSFYESLGLNASDYVSITSYTHHPFYEQFVLEIQDNWRWGLSYNVPLDEMMQIFDNAIENGYPIAWGSDVSEQGFRMGTRKGFCVLPADAKTAASLQGSDMAHWTGMKSADIQNEAQKHPTPQRWVSQDERQAAYDNRETTDDHGMVIYGTAKDQMGNEYYMVKNSWGDYGDYHGMFFASKAFVRYKTMNILVHKDAIPDAIAAKLGIQKSTTNTKATKKGRK
ncbi:MAG: C1 family peptidase [Bacteroidales bacterium]|nr:aminopeptidase [Candidatus Colimorpha merdihippi]MCQ2281737.1 C1 family peptidase [Bacteroidales bacterium]